MNGSTVINHNESINFTCHLSPRLLATAICLIDGNTTCPACFCPPLSTLPPEPFPRLAPIRAVLESVQRDSSFEALRPVFVFVASGMAVGPLLQFRPVLAHSVLPVARAPLLIQSRVSGRVVGVTHDLLPESVKAVLHVREVEALRLLVMHLRERCP